jgi:hypothetical protein
VRRFARLRKGKAGTQASQGGVRSPSPCGTVTALTKIGGFRYG